MKFHSEDTSLIDMTHNTSIPKQIFSILCLFLAEISMNFHPKDTSLRNMMCNSSIQNHNCSIQTYNFMNFLLIVSWNWVWNFIQKIPPGTIWHITLQFQIKIFQFCAYFWLILVRNFIKRRPPWDIWRVTLQFKIIISWVFTDF